MPWLRTGERGSQGSTCKVSIKSFLPSMQNSLEAGWTQLLMEYDDGYGWNYLPIFVTWHELWTDAWIESMDSLLGQHRRSRLCCKRMWGTCSLQLGLIGSLGGYCTWKLKIVESWEVMVAGTDVIRTSMCLTERMNFCQTAPFIIPSIDIIDLELWTSPILGGA